MRNNFKQMDASSRWQIMVGAAVAAMEKNHGWKMSRRPGRGLSNTWLMEKDGQTFTASIRTSQDRWLAFPPLNAGQKWKTLDDVQKVIVATVDNPQDPDLIEVYLFEQPEVRARFDKAYQARKAAGHLIKDNFGFWVNLDTDNRRDATYNTGAGLADIHQPISRLEIDTFASHPANAATIAKIGDPNEADDSEAPDFKTVGGVMAWARSTISRLADVPIDAVKLDLKIQY